MKFSLKARLRLAAAFAFAWLSGLASPAVAASCASLNPVNPIYGAGGSAVTATMTKVATALVALPAEERVTIFYNDPSACTGYQSLISPAVTDLTFKTWDANGTLTNCTAPASNVTFAHMGNTPYLCTGNEGLPEGFRQYVAPVQTLNVITGPDSDRDSISAEALYHLFGFGPGASGHSVAPWTNPNAVYARTVSSFVHLLLAGAIKVPPTAFKLIPAGNFLGTNDATAQAVYAWPTDNETLGYVSGSTADKYEALDQVKTLAYQHFGQSCGYLPDSSTTVRDKINVRTGQYYLWTPAWLYAKVDENGNAVAQDGVTPAPLVEKLIGWFDGSLDSPEGLSLVDGENTLTSITEIIIVSGDVPLCAMQAMRPEGDLSPIQSYANEKPCNGYYETVATGDTAYQECAESSECEGENEKCFYGFCEVTYPDSTN